MKEILAHIEKLENDSFCGWTSEEIRGYLTACVSIKCKILELLREKHDEFHRSKS